MRLDIKGNCSKPLKNEEIIMGTLNKFMMGRRFILEKPPKGEEGVVENLKKVEKELTWWNFYPGARNAEKSADSIKIGYDNAVKKLEDTKAKLADLQDQADKQKVEIDNFHQTLKKNYSKPRIIKKELKRV